MDLIDRLSALKSAAAEQRPFLNGKKKIENALLLPFFAALGYDPFDIREVEPFSTGLDEGEGARVDYAVKKGGSPAILFGLEETGTNLDIYDPSPLLQPLQESEARVGALTDGIEYRFYADLESFYAVLKGESPTERDPFLAFNLLNCSDREGRQLRRLTKPRFNADEILSFAHRLKYTRLFREYFQRQQESPDEAFVQFMMRQIHGGTVQIGDTGMYDHSVREALRQLIGDEDSASGQTSWREETKEETTEGGAVQSEGMHNEKAQDDEKADSEKEYNSKFNKRTPTDEDFWEFFEKRLGEDR